MFFVGYAAANFTAVSRADATKDPMGVLGFFAFTGPLLILAAAFTLQLRLGPRPFHPLALAAFAAAVPGAAVFNAYLLGQAVAQV